MAQAPRPPVEMFLLPDGQVSTAWLAYLEELSDRLSEVAAFVENTNYLRVDSPGTEPGSQGE